MTMSATHAAPRWSGARIALAVAGAVAALVGLAALVGGGALVAVHETQRDGDGFYASGANTLTTPTHALVSDELDIGADGPDWLFREGRLGTVRVTATGTGGERIFVGVARQARIDAYLNGVAHDVVTDIDLEPFTFDTAHRTGPESPAAPAAQGFWAERTSGTGEQSITWPVQKGAWAVVVMNADGSSGVQTDVSVGAKVGFLLWLGIGLLAAGAVAAIGGALMVFRARRRPRTPSPATSAVPAEAAGTA
jgi:hypothetical protein